MKKALIFSMIICIFSFAWGQGGNLQFNQVLLINDTITRTVPSGKLWKIVTFNTDQPSNSPPYQSNLHYFGCKINGGIASQASPTYNNYIDYIYDKDLPYYLPQNTSFKLYYSPSRRRLNIIEYNIIP